MPPTQIEEILDSYAGACTFLSRLFLEPVDEPLITSLFGGHDKAAEVAKTARAGKIAVPHLDDWPMEADGDTIRGLHSMRTGSTTPLDVLLIDHRNLFEGPDPVLASPYESVYLSDDHVTFEEQTLKVRAFYHRFGVQAPAVGKEPDDHIGLELSFISHLCLLALDAIELSEVNAETAIIVSISDFLDQHLLLWVDDCLDRVAEHANTDFYRGLGHLTRGTVRQLQATFQAQ